MTDIETEFGMMRVGINASRSAVLIESSSFDGQQVTVGITMGQAHALIAAIATDAQRVVTTWGDE